MGTIYVRYFPAYLQTVIDGLAMCTMARVICRIYQTLRDPWTNF